MHPAGARQYQVFDVENVSVFLDGGVVLNAVGVRKVMTPPCLKQDLTVFALLVGF